MQKYKSIRIDNDVYEILYNIQVKDRKPIKETVRDAILFYIQYRDKINENKETQIGIKDNECIFRYYTIKDGQKDYTCYILEKGIVTNYSDLLKYCKLCNRRALVLNLMKQKKHRSRLSDLIEVELRKRADGMGYFRVYKCKVCGDTFYTKRDALDHIRDIES